MAWAPDYITTEELKAFLRIGDDNDNTQLDLAITAASRAVDRHTNRQFGKVSPAEERFYTAEWDRRRLRWVVPLDDLMDLTGLDIQVQDADGNDVAAIDDYVLEPRNAAQKGRPYELLVVKPTSTGTPTGAEHEIASTGLWGWNATPSAVKLATKLQSSRFHSRRTSPYGVAGSPELGSELRLLARLDPDVAVSLGTYIRWWAGA